MRLEQRTLLHISKKQTQALKVVDNEEEVEQKK
jgi:hypothetical protein